MTEHETIVVERLDGSAAAAAEEAFRLVYAEAFAGPPYYETGDDVAATFRRFRSQTRKNTFRAALARTEAGEPVGIAYGYPLGPNTGWWDQLAQPVPEAVRHEDGRRTFGLMELAVRPAWRRRGIARRLHDAVLGDTEAGRVLLNVRPDSKAASAAYRAWGYHKVGDARPWDGAALHDVMVLDLR
ncbi:acetyltransferase [Streptomyces eurocidicus]|uniref:Acetyltransferase n=1 Tax=Streptomyces eurocidicus TaxID=66423 RepID=A0A2N8NVR3_STREU|nr:GNAT family N-acetyltransferase [Streptomyces eurocidicus]MBB5119194.1 ribosomal protein S18 acetylase RimI-like enzyme [Streptomyces eurocidicus]MBF6051705.1 GNAT family N-acetyltransferase [Streptomyces eurocidicus]PNE32873.1 acetyltransferase [Streptomyces eurocidicus]